MTDGNQEMNDKLRELMVRYGLSRRAVAELTRSSVFAVDSWTRPQASDGHRRMPVSKLELLELKLRGAR